jgi:GT2 family glycosyltransferase
MITAVTVVCNTFDLLKRMIDAFRTFHPDMLLIIIDNSDIIECREKIKGLVDENTIIYQFAENIGHGRGLNFAISKVTTKYVLIMDTDTVILKDPLPEMTAMIEDDTYGVGCITEVGRDGYDFGAFKKHKNPIKYLHPFFALINVKEYRKYKPFVHHGAPWYKVAVELHDNNLTHKIKHFNGLRAFDKEPSGRLIPVATEYVRHDFGGTRRKLRSLGRDEIKMGWIT